MKPPTKWAAGLGAATTGVAVVAGAALPVPAAAVPESPAPAVSRQRALDTAEDLLTSADAEVRRAEVFARAVRLDVADGTLSAQLSRQLQGAEAGGSDLQLLAKLVDPQHPAAALRTLGLADLVVGEAAAPPTTRTVPLQTPERAVAAATRQVRVAEQRRNSAATLLRQVRDPSRVGGPGAARLVQACADAGATARICAPVPWSQNHQVFDSIVIGRVVSQRWPQVRRVGGWRPYDPYPDHPSGRAVDIMMPSDGNGWNVELGDEIARYFQLHAEEFGVSYMIWRQRQWSATDRVGRWNAMSDRGDPTANHMDHVHITVHGGRATVFRQLLREALASPAP